MKKTWFYVSLILACVIFYQGIFENGSFSVQTVEKGVLFIDENVALSVKTLSAEESKKYLQTDVIDLGYQAVQISVENNSKESYLFSPESITLPLTDPKQVASEILKAATVRSLGFKVAGFIFWPLGIPGTIDSLWSLKNYRMIKEKWIARAVKEEIIPPYSVFHRVFFVQRESYVPSFTITLQNQETMLKHQFQVEGELAKVEPLPVVEENYYLTHEE